MTRDIVINGRFLSRRVTGVERYGREIIRLFENSHRVEKKRLNGPAGHAWEQLILPTKLRSESILWSPANTGPLMVRNQALTIHDLSPLEHPEWFKKVLVCGIACSCRSWQSGYESYSHHRNISSKK